jgi:hypothetical protein
MPLCSLKASELFIKKGERMMQGLMRVIVVVGIASMSYLQGAVAEAAAPRGVRESELSASKLNEALTETGLLLGPLTGLVGEYNVEIQDIDTQADVLKLLKYPGYAEKVNVSAGFGIR